MHQMSFIDTGGSSGSYSGWLRFRTRPTSLPGAQRLGRRMVDGFANRHWMVPLRDTPPVVPGSAAIKSGSKPDLHSPGAALGRRTVGGFANRQDTPHVLARSVAKKQSSAWPGWGSLQVPPSSG